MFQGVAEEEVSLVGGSFIDAFMRSALLAGYLYMINTTYRANSWK